MKEENHIFWRDEILQLLFWMKGEGMGETQSPESLARFLNVEKEILMGHLMQMASGGYLMFKPDGVSLSDLGRVEGARRGASCRLPESWWWLHRRGPLQWRRSARLACRPVWPR